MVSRNLNTVLNTSTLEVTGEPNIMMFLPACSFASCDGCSFQSHARFLIQKTTPSKDAASGVLWIHAALLVFPCLLLKLRQHVGRRWVSCLMRGDLHITIYTQVEIWARKVDTGLVHICQYRSTNCKRSNKYELKAIRKIARAGEKRDYDYIYQRTFD
jgi:hypothetical protein